MSTLNLKLDHILPLASKQISLTGLDDLTSLALLVSESVLAKSKPNLIVLESTASAEALRKELLFFNPKINIHVLSHFNSEIYSDVLPSLKVPQNRLNWLYHWQTARKGDIFVSTMTGLTQATMSLETFLDKSFEISPNNELPSNIAEILTKSGYTRAPLTEDKGTFSIRGGIIDIFSPAHQFPARIELFGDIIESIKSFSPKSQRSESLKEKYTITPAREFLYSDENRQKLAIYLKTSAQRRDIHPGDIEETLRDISTWKYFYGSDSFVYCMEDKPTIALDYVNQNSNIWFLNIQTQLNHFDKFVAEVKELEKSNLASPLSPEHHKLFLPWVNLKEKPFDKFIDISSLDVIDNEEQNTKNQIAFNVNRLEEFKKRAIQLYRNDQNEFKSFLIEKIGLWKEKNIKIVACSKSSQVLTIFKNIVSHFESEIYSFDRFIDLEISDHHTIYLVNDSIQNTIYIKNENLILLNLEQLFSKKLSHQKNKKPTSFKKAASLAFGDLKIGDKIVHKEHGIGLYQGLKIIGIGGVDNEFLQLEYKGKDKLYLPIYRISQIQKYSSANAGRSVDKLGGQSWIKVKTKVKSKLEDIASELLNLYAIREASRRTPFSKPDQDFLKFEHAFPFEETTDQLSAIESIIEDMTGPKPMDRLICGDVGFGKTEVAMRAAFKAAQDGRQVAIIAPTTILTFQHFETFKKRFKDWPLNIGCINRFVSKKEIKEYLSDLKAGKLDIIIGTHRLLSKDVEFNNLGLLVLDEEQKFGVKHKEKIRKIKNEVDTLTLSATPIPRTLNMSFMGLRDLSLINTAPVDRLPTRTFICKYEMQTIQKAVNNEIDRGGQVFFLHNRVNNIETIAQELREAMPNIRIGIGHGQMNETELENIMVKFFNHELDVLLATTIIESGIDIPNANTIIINNSQSLGLSQIYQLRGRVGRSSKRAYCYLMVPKNRILDKIALERLKVIKENSNLGSGLTIAQYDLELRGSGNILGENQSGHINVIGQELYMELLQECVENLKGEKTVSTVEPEINLKIPAFIPDKYIEDIRLRLSYYKALSSIESEFEIDQIENELVDQFGKLPEQTINLLGIMLIRHLCKTLFIKDLSLSKFGVTALFTENTPLSTEKILKLAHRSDNKYILSPDSKFTVRIKDKTWPRIYEELQLLVKESK